MKKAFLAFWILSFLAANDLHSQESARIESFTPQGTTKQVRQMRARFSEPMVPFGDPRDLAEPFEISCPEKGTARWADSVNWIYDFESDLPAGIRCGFTLKPGIKTLSGREVTGTRTFAFSTGGPAVKRSIPAEGAERIDEEQVFILYLDAEPEIESVLRNVFFSVEGVREKVGIRVLEGREREEILKTRGPRNRTVGAGLKPAPAFLIQAKQRFPVKARVSLIWGAGVMSATGVSSETDQVLPFKTRDLFSAAFRCERENPRAACIPLAPMRVEFSAPVAREWAGQIVLKGPDGRAWKPEKTEEEGPFFTAISFKGPFPESASFRVEVPSALKDDAGRPLANADQFPLAVRTDRYPPLAKFSSRFGILESKADPVLPVTLRNVEPALRAKKMRVDPAPGVFGSVVGRILNLAPKEKAEIQAWLRKVGSASRERSIFGAEEGVSTFQVPKTHSNQALEVVGIPLQKPGLYVIELESRILGNALLSPPRPMYVPTAVLVTNLSVHFKWGRESSLVWVTTLDKAEPVRDAVVTVRDCLERVRWEGKTDADGILRIDSALPPREELPRCDPPVDSRDYDQARALHLSEGLLVTARTHEDISFVHSTWNEGIEAWRFQLPYEDYWGPVAAHTVFDRTLLRAGQTVHMKHILRRRTMKGFAVPGEADRPDRVSIQHAGSGQKYDFPLKWDASGVAETSWSIPQDARLGNYEILLIRKGDRGGDWQRTSGSFRVEEFRVPLLRGTIQPPAEPLIRAGEIPLGLSVQYLAGGGAGFLPVRIRSEVRPGSSPSFEGFEGFIFGAEPVKEGIVRRGAAMEEEEGPEGEPPMGGSRKRKLPPSDLVLDRSGTGRGTLGPLPEVEVPMSVLAEMEFKDPNGEIQTVSSSVRLWPSGYLAGVKPDSWAVSRENFKFQVAVLDLSGKPVAGAPVKSDLFQRKTYTHRKRIAGGFYSYDHVEETKRVGALCAGTTDARGLLTCESRSPAAGNLIVQAETADPSGRRAVSQHEVWVAEKDDWWFALADHDRIDLIPEKKRYEPGETAVFQVRMPFREATALVTVEREGVMESLVRKISGTKPILEIPVKGNYAPNVFVSVLPLRGRVTSLSPTGLADLGKPAHKLGIGEIQVGWREHELKVNVTPERRVYKVRQKARVKVSVRTWEGKPPPHGSEAAIAAVDEGLLELMPNGSWKILPAMMGRRGYGVQTATAQGQVIGRRHFGLKALPQGGGGGRAPTRELFDTLLLWKARVPLDSNGDAWVEVPLNDSITSFQIVAVATGGAGLFGTGTASIQSTQDLMVMSGLPPLVREGDRIRAEFTLRNTTSRNMEGEISAAVRGLPRPLPARIFTLAPGEAGEIAWDVSIPAGVESLSWELEAKAKGSGESDRLKVLQKVAPAVPVRTYQATIAQVEKGLEIPVERPPDALPGRGGVSVSLRPRLADSLNGITEYMRAYPYGCLEQRISKAVSLRDQARWKDLMARLPSYLDADGLLKYFPAMRVGDEILTSYVLAAAHEAGWPVPAEAGQKMDEGLKNFIEGRITRGSPLPTVDLSIRKLSAMETLSRRGKFATHHLNSIPIEPNLWPTSALIDWINLLRNAPEISGRSERLKEAENIMAARLNFQGTAMAFSTEKSDCLWWLMVSGDVNAVRALLALLPSEKWKEDLPRLVQGALARQRKGKWDLTLANAWGVLALEKFSRAYEAVPVSGTTRAQLETRSQSIDWKTSPKGKVSLFSWPEGKRELSISHAGEGRPWATVSSLAAIPLRQPLFSGYTVQKSLAAVQRKDAARWTRGDILRVRLEVEAQADQTWVVVNDPVPAGCTILGSGLSRDSQLLTQDEKREGRVWPAYEERSFEAFRSYYQFVPKGKWTVEYTIRLNQSGVFRLPATRVESLYLPEMFGEIPNGDFEVQP